MRIGIDARMYGAKATSGIGVYIQKLLEYLFVIDTTNTYIVFLGSEAYKQFTPPRENIYKVEVNISWYSLEEQVQLPFILRKYKLDVVHFPHFNVPLLYRKKFISTIHDITPLYFPGPTTKKFPIRKIAYQQVLKKAITKSHKTITISEHTKKNIQEYFSVPTSKIEVTYLGVGAQYKVITNAQLINTIKQLYNITKPFLLFVGVWRDHKNIEALVTGFEILKQQYGHDYQLVIAGKPDDNYPEIKKRIDSSPCRESIITPGFVPASHLPMLYNAAALFILPSFCEGFGLVALESLACGTPVVASNTTSVPEIIGEAGMYFNPHNPQELASQIAFAINNQDQYQQKVLLGIEKAKEYSWQATAVKTLKLYQSVN